MMFKHDKKITFKFVVFKCSASSGNLARECQLKTPLYHLLTGKWDKKSTRKYYKKHNKIPKKWQARK